MSDAHEHLDDLNADDFISLALSYIENRATPEECARLGDLLAASPDARRTFNRLTAQLFALQNRTQVTAAHTPKTVGGSPPPAPASPPISAAGVPMYRKGCEPQPFKLRAHHVALAAAALLVACGLAVYLLTATVDPKPDPVDPNQPPTPVATLIENTGDLRTPHGYPAEGDDYGRGEYTLASGTAEFMLTNSVNVKLRGDTRIVMRDDMNVTLSDGRAAFVVPKNATGFTIHLPDRSQIIDLGTAFEVNVDDSGHTRLRVTEGSVAWYQEESTVASLIHAGQSVRIEDGELRDAAVLAVTTQRSDEPPTFSNTDLAQSQFLSSAATGSSEAVQRHAQLFNGIIGDANGLSNDTGEAKLEPGDTVTVNLDLSVHAHGYDITGIDTLFGWSPSARGRSNQGYSIELTYVDGSTATLVEPTHWEPNTPASYWTKVSFNRADGETLRSDDVAINESRSAMGPSVLASGVKAVTFKLTHGANAGGPVVAREIDIFGTPTPALSEPKSREPVAPATNLIPLPSQENRETPL